MKKRRSRIPQEVGMFLSLMILLLGAGIIVSFIYGYNKMYLTNLQDTGKSILKVAAQDIDGNKISRYTETLEADDYYNIKIASSLNRIKNNFPEITFLYLFEPREDYMIYIFEAQRPYDDPEEIAPLGEIYYYEGSDKDRMKEFVANPSAERGLDISPDLGYGRMIMCMYPIYDSMGNFVGALEADFSVEETIKTIIRNVWTLVVLLMLINLVMGIIFYRFLKDRVTKPLTELNSFVDSYEAGKFNEPEPTFKRDDEIKWLNDSFKDMAGKIDEYVENIKQITADTERIEAELNVATQIQDSFLPKNFPDNEIFSLSASMDPAKEVGGDFYDFFKIDENKSAIVMADVSGKGVPAALIMAITKSLIKSTAKTGGMGPAEVFKNVNMLIAAQNDACMFITAWMAVFDSLTGTVKCVNAGHEYPVLLRYGSSKPEYYHDEHGLPLGVFDEAEYTEYELEFNKGDKLFVYTDGVLEATSIDKELYGEDRLLEILEKCNDIPMREVLVKVREDIDVFVKGAEQFDDITMLAFELKP